MATLRHKEMKILINESFCDIGFVGKQKAQLYNLKTDPSEKQNLVRKKPEIVQDLLMRLRKYCDSMISSVVMGTVVPSEADPVNFGGYVSSGWCEAKPL